MKIFIVTAATEIYTHVQAGRLMDIHHRFHPRSRA